MALFSAYLPPYITVTEPLNYIQLRFLSPSLSKLRCHILPSRCYRVEHLIHAHCKSFHISLKKVAVDMMWQKMNSSICKNVTHPSEGMSLIDIDRIGTLTIDQSLLVANTWILMRNSMVLVRRNDWKWRFYYKCILHLHLEYRRKRPYGFIHEKKTRIQWIHKSWHRVLMSQETSTRYT